MDADQARLDAEEARYQAKISFEKKLKKLAEGWHLSFQSPYENAAKQAFGVRFAIHTMMKAVNPRGNFETRSWDDLNDRIRRGPISDAQLVAEHPSTTLDELRIRHQTRPYFDGGNLGDNNEDLEDWDEPTVAYESKVLDKLKISLLENLANAWHSSFQSPFENAARQAHSVRVGIHKAKNLIPTKYGGMDTRAWDELDDHIRHGLVSDAQYVAEHPATSEDDLRIRYQDRWITEADKQGEAGDWSHDDLDGWDDPTLECEEEVLEKLKRSLTEHLTLLAQFNAAKP